MGHVKKPTSLVYLFMAHLPLDHQLYIHRTNLADDVKKHHMACCSELGGCLLSGNMMIHLLTYILHTKAGLTDLQIQAEVKSDASVEVAGSKVVINFGCTLQ